MQQSSSTVRHRRQNNKLRKNITNTDLTRNNRYKTLSNSYEKSTFTYLGQRHLKNSAKNSSSPVQTKARAVIRKYKLQLRQLEFKRLKQIVPTMQNSDSTNDSDEVSTKIIYIKSNFK